MFSSSRNVISNCICAIVVAAFGSQHGSVWGADRIATLMPYVNSDTFAVAYVDVASIKIPDIRGALVSAAPKLSGGVQSLAFAVWFAEGVVNRFQDAGGQGIFIVAGLADVHAGGGPLVVATAQQGRQPEEIERLGKDLIQEFAKYTSRSDARSPAEQLEVQRTGDVVLFGMKSSIDRYTAGKTTKRTELVEPLAKLADNGSVASFVFCPGADFRRVVRELWPALPGALAPLRGELADRWISLEGSINMPPNVNPRLTLQAKDPEAAEVFAKLWHDLPVATTEFGDKGESSRQAQGYAQLLVDTLPAKVEGTRVEIGFPTDAGQFAKLGSMFSAAADKSMEASRRTARLNSFKQLMLAMFNFESAKKHLPPAAICDKDGKPLLSWRVALLPFLDEMELYKQFHLDEAWDSPHNRPLVEKMPAIYTDPDPKIQTAAGVGKTTFQVPVGKETIFYSSEGTTFHEITDGTANTIALIEVDPQQAVEWTKPADWKVDLAHPREGLGARSHNYVSAAYADGHIEILSGQQLEDRPLRASLTRAGREPTNQ